MSLLVRVLLPMPPPKLKSLLEREWVATEGGICEGGALAHKGGNAGHDRGPIWGQIPQSSAQPVLGLHTQGSTHWRWREVLHGTPTPLQVPGGASCELSALDLQCWTCVQG